MPTKFGVLSKENYEILHRIAMGIYLDGACYEFALALHRTLGWPLVGLMDVTDIRHALVRSPGGYHYDVRGRVHRKDIGQPFNVYRPYVLKEIQPDDLYRIRQIAEGMVHRAEVMAQAMWPSLPWCHDSFIGRSKAFMNELEALCKKHDVWIRACIPLQPIVLAERDGGEGGFSMTPTLDGQYFFDRNFSDSA